MTKRRLLQALTTPILILPAALVLALMVVIPLAVLVWYSFAPDGPGAPLSLDSYRRMVASPLYGRLALKTLVDGRDRRPDHGRHRLVSGLGAVAAFPSIAEPHPARDRHSLSDLLPVC